MKVVVSGLCDPQGKLSMTLWILRVLRVSVVKFDSIRIQFHHGDTENTEKKSIRETFARGSYEIAFS
jgi:hypothetical protein